ncbi:lysophospholipid acyltransferase family protein [Candidatus Magnetominusculus xianensis]|uniref:Lipid A biosynthesis acyltransferase n=1 Tax=Candidatus Magnetominusculus xianensis TaxID=1748249 RepID=A0ABR5SHQ0_9BACT|nr:lysophospholipid acyltransferase family protein [Candidatus Magnetominusculus xianensis]KWT91698.1 lipid A biosynthesis acyltransferase [Candidatus Magnetominusculus xianensis]MBF0404548.1 lysophospholipid acyltransferase family protein [Nitrospirota bacterium]
MVTKESIVRDLFRLVVWYPLRWTIEALPLTSGLTVLNKMGELHFALSRGKTQALEENLSRFMSVDNTQKALIIQDYMKNHYVDRLMIFLFPKFNKRQVDKVIEFEGLSYLDAALKKGRGVILVHGHFGPVHIPLVALARLGYKMKQIGLPSDDGLSWIGRHVAFRLRLRYEAKIPAEIVNAESFLRPVFLWLKEGGVVMVTGDGSGTQRHVGRHDVFDFLGQKVMFPLGPAILSEKTGAEILPLFVTPGQRKPYKILIGAPLTKADEPRDIHAITKRFITELERKIKTYPAYMHFLDRFKAGEYVVS